MSALSPAIAAALARVRPPFASSPTLPPAAYRDAAVLAAEDERLFRRGWVGVGRGDRWARSGDYAALEIGSVPVIVLRDGSGRLRAYANSCRHRGAKLLEGSGRVAAIACPFHAWSYGLDGALRSAPRMDHAVDVAGSVQNGGAQGDGKDWGLIAFRAEERAGFAFVCLDAGAPALDAWLGDFEAMHSPWPLATLATFRRRELEVACNWKLFLEIFNEYYHLPYVHGASLGGIYGEPDPADEVAGAFTTQFGLTRGSGGLTRDEQEHKLPAMPGLTGRNRQGTRYSWLFPAMTFAAGAEALWVYEARPLTAGRCRVALSLCFPPRIAAAKGFEAKAARYGERMDRALDEDIAILERQQQGLASPFARPGRFSELEPSVARFAFWYAAQMTGQ